MLLFVLLLLQLFVLLYFVLLLMLFFLLFFVYRAARLMTAAARPVVEDIYAETEITAAEARKLAREIPLPLIINQNRYSILDRTIEKNGLKDFAREDGMGVICFSPLAQGMLSEKYLNGIPSDSRIAKDGRFLHADDLKPEKMEGIRRLDEIAKRRGQTLPQMALAWDLRDPEITSVLIGASKPQQILENLGAIENTSFSAEELREIDEIQASIAGELDARRQV